MHSVAILGAGPTGLAAFQELLRLGLDEGEILLIDPNVNRSLPEPIESANQLGTFESFKVASENGALKKVGGPDLSVGTTSGLTTSFFRPADYWGASCLPPPAYATGYGFESREFQSAYSRTVERWGVQAERDLLQDVYPLTGETIGELQRKALARTLCLSGCSSDLLVGHARLAMSQVAGLSCNRCGYCLQGCPRNVPWSPTAELFKLRTEVGTATWINASVERIHVSGRDVEISTSDHRSFRARYALLAVGWRTTPKLYAEASTESLMEYHELAQSTVIMKPFIFISDHEGESFGSSFTFHDIVLSIPPRQESQGYTVQIYLPTPELAGRIFAATPKFMHEVISRTVRNSNRPINWLQRRLGVAMIFSNGSAWHATRPDLQQVESEVMPHLAKLLKTVGGHLLPSVRVVLDAGRSEHVGAWKPIRNLASRVLDGSFATNDRGYGLFPIDTTLLPMVPSGPHTSTSAALARMLVGQLEL